jgi:hypothetical protein
VYALSLAAPPEYLGRGDAAAPGARAARIRPHGLRCARPPGDQRLSPVAHAWPLPDHVRPHGLRCARPPGDQRLPPVAHSWPLPDRTLAAAECPCASRVWSARQTWPSSPPAGVSASRAPTQPLPAPHHTHQRTPAHAPPVAAQPSRSRSRRMLSSSRSAAASTCTPSASRTSRRPTS